MAALPWLPPCWPWHVQSSAGGPQPTATQPLGLLPWPSWRTATYLGAQLWRWQGHPVRGTAVLPLCTHGNRQHPVPRACVTAGGNYRVDAPGLYSLRGGSLKKVGGRPVMVVSVVVLCASLPASSLRALGHRPLPPRPSQRFPGTYCRQCHLHPYHCMGTL